MEDNATESARIALYEWRQKLSDRSFDSIYSDYSRLVFWAAYRVVPNRETAEDITQIAFERVLSNLGRLAGLDDGQLKSWLYRVSTNIARENKRVYRSNGQRQRKAVLAQSGERQQSGKRRLREGKRGWQ